MSFKIKKYILFLFKAIFYLLYTLTPKKNIYLFSQAGNKINGNSKLFFEYLNNKKIKNTYWLYHKKPQNQKRIEPNKKLIYLYSFKGLLLVLQSKHFFITHGWGDFGYYGESVRKNMYNLWHGIFIKNIGYLDKGDTNIKKPQYNKIFVASDIERYAMCSATKMNIDDIIVCGTPRIDKYLTNFNKYSETKKNTIIKKMLYAPTFRDYELKEDLFFPFSDFSIEKLKQYFSKNSQLQIYLRPHPNDKKSVNQAEKLELEFPNNIVHFSRQVCDDIDEVLYQFDTVITDYSSIYIEPLLGDTPCIFVPFDYDCYMETRGLAYDYEMVTPGPKVRSFAEFLEAVEDALQGAQDWKIKRKLVTDIFFKYKDANACERIATEVLGLDIPTAKSEKINR